MVLNPRLSESGSPFFVPAGTLLVRILEFSTQRFISTFCPTFSIFAPSLSHCPSYKSSNLCTQRDISGNTLWDNLQQLVLFPLWRVGFARSWLDLVKVPHSIIRVNKQDSQQTRINDFYLLPSWANKIERAEVLLNLYPARFLIEVSALFFLTDC